MESIDRGRRTPSRRHDGVLAAGALAAALAAGAGAGVLLAGDPDPPVPAVREAETGAPLPQAPAAATEGLLTAGLFLAALVAAALFVVRRGPRLRPGGRQIRVVESVALGPRRALHVVRCGERRYLIGDSERGLTYIATLEPASDDEPAPEGEGEPTFDSVLARKEDWR